MKEQPQNQTEVLFEDKTLQGFYEDLSNLVGDFSEKDRNPLYKDRLWYNFFTNKLSGLNFLMDILKNVEGSFPEISDPNKKTELIDSLSLLAREIEGTREVQISEDKKDEICGLMLSVIEKLRNIK